MSAALNSLQRGYSRALHPTRRALRTALVAALAGLAIMLPAAILIGLLP